MSHPAPTTHWSDMIADAEAIVDALSRRTSILLPASVVASACRLLSAMLTLGLSGHRVQPDNAAALWEQAHTGVRDVLGAIVLHGGLGE